MLKEIFTDEILSKTEELAALLFSPREIGIYLQLPDDEVSEAFADKEHAFTIAYEKGKMQSQIALREQLLKMAKLGSPAAQEQAIRLMDKQRIKTEAWEG